MATVPRTAPSLRTALLAATAAVGLFGGCAARAPAAPEGPDRAVLAYVRAVRAGDARAAYALLDADTRAGMPYERFARLMRENRAELQAQADALAQEVRQGVTPRARAQLPEGGSVVLVREGAGWRIEAGVAEVPSLATPRDAVLALRRALLRRDLHALERVLSRGTRAELEADIERFLDETADELDLEYEVRGNRARVLTTDGREIQLVREAGEWRVVDVQ